MSRQMNLPAKKRFGQHFLRDRGTLDRIVRLIQPAPDDVILEIGAGDGALSARLAACTPHLMALELDLDCLPRLRDELMPFPEAKVIAGDILKVDLEATLGPFLPAARLRMVGNLPYNIATAIIERLLSSALPIHDMTFMVQLEVAQRIVAPPESRLYGFLSVACQHLSEIRIAFKVSASCFVPRPRVSSAIICLCPKPGLRDPIFESGFLELTKAAFSHRRKTLSNSLAHHPTLGPISETILALGGIDGRRRAEALAVEEYESLTNVFVNRLKHR